MSALPLKATNLMRRNETPLCAISGLTHRSKTASWPYTSPNLPLHSGLYAAILKSSGARSGGGAIIIEAATPALITGATAERIGTQFVSAVKRWRR